MAVSPETNRLYVANFGGSVTVIDGASNATATVAPETARVRWK